MDSGLDPDRPVLLPLVLQIYENTLPPAHDPVPLPGYAVSQRCRIYPSRCLGSNLPQGVGNHIVSRHPEKQGARGIDLNGGNWSSTWQRYPCLSLPLHPPTYQWCYPGHPTYYPTHGSTPSSISSRHITSTLRIATQKLGFQKLGFFPPQNRISLPTVGGGTTTLHLAGVPEHTIKIIGRWQSYVFLIYL